MATQPQTRLLPTCTSRRVSDQVNPAKTLSHRDAVGEVKWRISGENGQILQGRGLTYGMYKPLLLFLFGWLVFVVVVVVVVVLGGSTWLINICLTATLKKQILWLFVCLFEGLRASYRPYMFASARLRSVWWQQLARAPGLRPVQKLMIEGFSTDGTRNYQKHPV